MWRKVVLAISKVTATEQNIIRISYKIREFVCCQEHILLPTVTKRTRRCRSQLVGIERTTIPDSDISLEMAATIEPLKADAPCHNPFMTCRVRSVQPSWRMRVTAALGNATCWHLDTRPIAKSVPGFLCDQRTITEDLWC